MTRENHTEAVEKTSDAALRLGLKPPDSRCSEFYMNGWRMGTSYGDYMSTVRHNIRMHYDGVRKHPGNEPVARAFVRGYRDGRRAGRRASQLSKAEVLW